VPFPPTKVRVVDAVEVDRPEQTSGFGAYSLTCTGPDLEDAYAPDGVTPGLVDALLQLQRGGTRVHGRATPSTFSSAEPLQIV
jgi:hypothetical protein